MAEVRVPYQVNGRQFEGMVVYDDTVQRKRPIVFMQPDWKGVCADTVAQAHAVAGADYVVLMADMFGAGYGDTIKTREQLAAGMKAVHDDLVFTLSCGSKAYETLLAESTKLGLIDVTKKLATGYCAPAVGSRLSRLVLGPISTQLSSCTSPILIQSYLGHRATSEAEYWRSTALPIRSLPSP
jgi:dienelactone hydrolase